MTEKKPLEVPFEDIKQGPIRHREGLQPDEIPVVVGMLTTRTWRRKRMWTKRMWTKRMWTKRMWTTKRRTTTTKS